MTTDHRTEDQKVAAVRTSMTMAGYDMTPVDEARGRRILRGEITLVIKLHWKSWRLKGIAIANVPSSFAGVLPNRRALLEGRLVYEMRAWMLIA